MTGNKYTRLQLTPQLEYIINSQSLKYNDILEDWLHLNSQGDTKIITESKKICRILNVNEIYTRYYLEEWADDVFYYEVFLKYDGSKSSFNTFFDAVTKNKIKTAIQYYQAKGRRQLLIDTISIDNPINEDASQTIADMIADNKDYELELLNTMCDDTTSKAYKSLIQSLSWYARTILTLKTENGLKKARIMYLMGISNTEYERYWQEFKRKSKKYY